METSVAWPHHSDIDRTRLAAVLLDDAVTAIQNRGHTREHALRLAAQTLGLTFRRARALLYGEPVALLDEELARIRAAFLAHLDAEAAHLDARLAAVRERMQRLREGGP
jgi:hypothetical protein